MAKFVSEKIKMKTESRLAAVQATYMIAFGQLPVDQVIKDFQDGNVGRFVIEEDTDTQQEEMVEVNNMDKAYFEQIVRGVQKNKEALEKSLHLSPAPARVGCSIRIIFSWIRCFLHFHFLAYFCMF